MASANIVYKVDGSTTYSFKSNNWSVEVIQPQLEVYRKDGNVGETINPKRGFLKFVWDAPMSAANFKNMATHLKGLDSDDYGATYPQLSTWYMDGTNDYDGTLVAVTQYKATGLAHDSSNRVMVHIVAEERTS